jgi:hypothetical protein
MNEVTETSISPIPELTRVADGARSGGSGTIHPNAYHPNACMVDRISETRYCGWLLHGHPWCGTHGHKCEELPLLHVDSKGRGS